MQPLAPERGAERRHPGAPPVTLMALRSGHLTVTQDFGPTRMCRVGDKAGLSLQLPLLARARPPSRGTHQRGPVDSTGGTGGALTRVFCVFSSTESDRHGNRIRKGAKTSTAPFDRMPENKCSIDRGSAAALPSSARAPAASSQLTGRVIIFSRLLLCSA